MNRQPIQGIPHPCPTAAGQAPATPWPQTGVSRSGKHLDPSAAIIPNYFCNNWLNRSRCRKATEQKRASFLIHSKSWSSFCIFYFCICMTGTEMSRSSRQKCVGLTPTLLQTVTAAPSNDSPLPFFCTLKVFGDFSGSTIPFELFSPVICHNCSFATTSSEVGWSSEDLQLLNNRSSCGCCPDAVGGNNHHSKLVFVHFNQLNHNAEPKSILFLFTAVMYERPSVLKCFSSPSVYTLT